MFFTTMVPVFNHISFDVFRINLICSLGQISVFRSSEKVILSALCIILSSFAFTSVNHRIGSLLANIEGSVVILIGGEGIGESCRSAVNVLGDFSEDSLLAGLACTNFWATYKDC